MPDGPTGQGAAGATGQGESLAGEASTAQAQQQQAQQHVAQGQQDDTDAEFGAEFDRDKALQTIKAQRASERKALRERDAALAELKKRQDAEKTEAERLAERVKELETAIAQRDQQLTQTAIEAALRDAGAKHPDLLVARVSAADLDRDERGRFSNLDKQVDTLRQRYPDLFFSRTGSADGGGGLVSAATDSMNSLIRRAAGRA